jgi:hypothetical protein
MLFFPVRVECKQELCGQTWICFWLVVCNPYESYLILLHLSFFLCKTRMVINLSQRVVIHLTVYVLGASLGPGNIAVNNNKNV